ncbi:MAG: thiazole biosynthesis protein [Spirochaetes bacterium]|nr:thiazole biosynthesis protein [Spirochaetota bacterium]
MKLDERIISQAIIEKYYNKLKSAIDTDVILVGAGPSNLVASYYLSQAKLKAVIFESKLAPGGGVWGGGMMFNEVVVQKSCLPILDEIGVAYSHYQDEYYTTDSVHLASMLIAKTTLLGTTIFNLVKVVDVMFREKKGKKLVCGAVIQYSPIEHLGLHVDPLAVHSKALVDGTGHPAEICGLVTKKLGIKIASPTGSVPGEQSMYADLGEETVVKNTTEVFQGLWVVGMAANNVMATPRMGPVFGGMIQGGKFLADQLIKKLK